MVDQSNPIVAGKDYKIEMVKVGDLNIDRTVQRSNIDLKKVERLKRSWNPGAAGVLVVSRRKDRSQVVLDGQHRQMAFAQLSDNQGEIECQVFTDLTLAEEAQLFLDTNFGNQPSLIDKFRVSTVAGNTEAIHITKLIRAFGWDVVNSSNPGSVKAVGALQRIYRLGETLPLEPHLLHATMMVVTHAWGLDTEGVQAVILEGVAAVIEENDTNLDLKVLETRLARYPGGPSGLHVDATQLAAIKARRVSMAVAEQITDHYNKTAKGKPLPQWRRRK